MPSKYLVLNDSLHGYLQTCRSGAADPLLASLRRETEALGEIARMQISPEQGSFLTFLAGAIGAKRILEIGTFTGYSAICLARALPEDGELICLDSSEAWTAIARKYWDQAGLAGKISLRLGDALQSLQQLPRGLFFDLAFIDAEKTQYDAYYEESLPRVRPNGLLIFDNMLWGGRLGQGPVKEASGQAIDGLNRKLAADQRVESVLLPIADGLMLCRKK